MGAGLVAFLIVCWCFCDTARPAGAEETMTGYIIKELPPTRIQSVHVLHKFRLVERLHKLNFVEIKFYIFIKNNGDAVHSCAKYKIVKHLT